MSDVLDPQHAGFLSKPDGYITLDGMEVAHTVQCCHCNRHFFSRRGSGHLRGYCTRCGHMTCGRSACDPCVPWERQMERVEKAAKILLP